ncbi:16905_t:CDS:2, partial [Racocetra persica]
PDIMSTVVNVEEKTEKTERCLAISPEGDFVVEFVQSNFELRMYNVENPGKDDLNVEDNKRLSYRTLSHGSKLDFSELISSMKKPIKNMLKWSVAVSDKSINESMEFRLLAISCISHEDMRPKKERQVDHYKDRGFTMVFRINKDKDDYSIIDVKDKELLIEYGGIVKLFSNQDNQKIINDQKIDEYFLILLKASGIYKYHLKYLRNELNNKVQKLKYPKRIRNTIVYNSNPTHTSQYMKISEMCVEYIQKCLHKHYFLVDSKHENVPYMELYDLKTNQLINTFQRQNIKTNLSFIIDIPDTFAISNNDKLLAYNSKYQINIYLIECGIEIASMEIDKFTENFNKVFMQFFHNDEKLLVYLSEDNWSIWDIFCSVQRSIKLQDPTFKFDITEVPLVLSNSFLVFIKKDELNICDDLIIDKHFKLMNETSDKHVWKELTLKEEEEYFIVDLGDQKQKELDKYYHVIEPWVPILCDPRYSFNLDKENEKEVLLIGNRTIQVWRDLKKSKRRDLKFVCVISDMNEKFEVVDLTKEKMCGFEVKQVEYAAGKFKILIKLKHAEDAEETFQLKIDDDYDIIDTVKCACYALKYFSGQKQSEILLDEDRHSKFNDIIKQTRNIIIRFIKLYPVIWRLLDVRFDLMSVLIESKEYALINEILFGATASLHVPQYSSWSGGKNTIRKAFSDPTILAYLLEYYSNNAINNIGWMNTVVEIIPDLYRENYGVDYAPYARKLFQHPCFCNKQLDLYHFEFLEISPNISGLMKIFIPITQLIPQESTLDLQEINYDKISDIRMIPLVDFTINKKLMSGSGGIITILKSLFLIDRIYLYFSCKIMDYSPFIQLIKSSERDIFDENPSIGAAMTWMFILLGYPLYIGLSQSPETYEVTNGNVVYTMTQKTLDNPFSNFFRAILSVYNWSSISLDTWNFWPLAVISLLGGVFFAIILQNVIISFMNDAFSDAVANSKRAVYSFQSDLIYEYAIHENLPNYINDIDSKFKDKLRARYICFYDEPSITQTWKEKSSKLEFEPYPQITKPEFILLGYPLYIGLSQSPETYEVTNGNVVYTMTQKTLDNPFSNFFRAILSVYNWSSISLDTWNFWPLAVISLLGGVFFAIILQNVIISFMNDAFSDAVANSKRAVYSFQSDLIYEYAIHENLPNYINDIDSKFKDKLRARYICFYDEPSITQTWKEKSSKLEFEPYPQITKPEFDPLLIEKKKKS